MGKRLTKIGLSILPWLIIAGLLWAGLFIKPAPVGNTVQPPTIEMRDYYYGCAQPASGLVWLAGSNGKIVALGTEGQVVRLATPTDKTLQDVATWSRSNAVAVGDDGVIITTADGGAHWVAAENVPRSAVANKLVRVRVAGEGLAVAVGEMGALLLSKDWGKSWQRIRPEEDRAWNDAALLPDGRVVVVGEFGKILLGDIGGGDWLEVKSPVQMSLMSVAFRDARNGAAVGLEGVILTTSDGGRNWVRVDSGMRDHLFSVSWDKVRERWVAGGSLGRWAAAKADSPGWQTGRLDPRDLSWHTCVLPDASGVWFVGANIGKWDGERWQALSEAWQLKALFSLPVTTEKKTHD